MRAHCLIRPAPFYRREAFISGLRAAGHEVVDGVPTKPDENTLICIWNRYGSMDSLASMVEAAGGVTIVCENGYLGAGGTVPKWDVHPSGPKPGDYYALALGGPNGSGRWYIPPESSPEFGERWDQLGVELRPWRAAGGHVLVCPSRPFGRPGSIMPADWPERTVERLRQLTDRPVRVRAHPGNDAPQRPLSQDLEGVSEVVIWASSAGVHALVAGIPVFQCAPHWICTGAASLNLAMIEDPAMDCDRRLSALRRMAWAQWTCREIGSGEAFRRLPRAEGGSLKRHE